MYKKSKGVLGGTAMMMMKPLLDQRRHCELLEAHQEFRSPTHSLCTSVCPLYLRSGTHVVLQRGVHMWVI